MKFIGDNINPKVNTVKVEEVLNGSIKMPFNQKSAWLKTQQEDRAHRMLLNLIRTSQAPEPKKTKGDFTTLKRLHGLYRSGNLKVSADGLVTVTTSDIHGNSYDAISVPTRFFPGLIHALHLKLDHPSKSQLQRLVARHFYSPGQVRIIDEVAESCVICSSLKTLPKEIFTESTAKNETFGAAFSADVIKKDSQLILVCREKLSQFTASRIIPDESADSLRDNIVSSVLEFLPDSGTTIQVDCATGFQKLASECSIDGNILKKFGISIDLGRSHNVNKNPVAENCVKEFLKERLRLSPHGGPVSEVERAQITKNMNSRIRERGYTAKEMAFNRDQISNETKHVSDRDISEIQLKLRKARHPKVVHQEDYDFKVGDNVFLKKDLSKLRGREIYKIIKIYQKSSEAMATVRKCENKYLAKDYEVKLAEIKLAISSKAPAVEDESISESTLEDVSREVCENNDESKDVQNNKETGRPKRKAAENQRELMRNLIDSSTLAINTSKKAPTHPFDYNEWVKLLNDDDNSNTIVIRSKPLRVKPNPIAKELVVEPNPSARELVAAIKIQKWFRKFLNNQQSSNLSWDHSPQDVNSEANFDWSNQLEPRNPKDFVRLFTDEVVEEALETINDINNPVNIDIVAVDDVEE